VVAICESPFAGFNSVLKRLSDIVFASAALLALWPVMLAITIGIKWTSPGPVLFKQRRYGLDGAEIMVYKFRSMKVLGTARWCARPPATMTGSRRSERSCAAPRSTSCRSS
jgi:lipopolysaccharide/colanic/teichoic acid biosynthesis glycosyltransferase